MYTAVLNQNEASFLCSTVMKDEHVVWHMLNNARNDIAFRSA